MPWSLRYILYVTVFNVECLGLSHRSRVSSVARIRASMTSIQKVKDRHLMNTEIKPSSSSCLEEYMQLPASQYSCVRMPLNSSLDRILGTLDQFELRVPPIKLALPIVPTVEVRPLVLAKVNVEKYRVIITSSSCKISGSKIIQDLKINNFFDFNVEVRLTWKTSSQSSSMKATSAIEINLKPLPGIFAIIPRSILENVGNNAIRISLKYLQNNFMKSLAKDFERWSIDEEYREQRKKLQFLADSDIILDDNELKSVSTTDAACMRKDEILNVI